MHEHVLAPTDRSDAVEYVVEQVVDLVPKYGATVHTLYVVDVDATSYSLGMEQVDRIRWDHPDGMLEVKNAADAATGYVTAAAAEHGLAVREHAVSGEPARVIRKFVEDSDIDLVVIGSRSRSGLSRVVLGSVTERVLRRTRFPVLVVDVHEKKAGTEAEADTQPMYDATHARTATTRATMTTSPATLGRAPCR